MMRRAFLLAVALAGGCSGAAVETRPVERAPSRALPPAPRPENPVGVSPASDAGAAAAAAGAVATAGAEDNPLRACDVVESLEKAAGYSCADGARPLGGDRGAARAARSDTRYRAGTDNRVDAYDVPCPAGPHRIYVEIRACPAAPPPAAPALGPSMYDRISQLGAARDYSAIVAVCDDALGQRSPSVEARWECAKNGTAARLLLRRETDALSFAADWCRSFSNEETRLDIAASVVALVADQHRGTNKPLAADARAKLSEQLGKACLVPAKDVDALVGRRLW